MVKESSDGIVCPECQSKNIGLSIQDGHYVCLSCGLVQDEIVIDSSPEYRVYSSEEARTKQRVGAPLSLLKVDKGLSTSIGTSDRDAFGRPISPMRLARMRRLRRLNLRESRSEIRNLRQALREISRIVSELGFPESVAETASLYYRKALKAQLVRGRSIKCMVAASVYLACRELNIPIVIKDLEAVSSENRKSIARCYRVIVEKLRIQVGRQDPSYLINRLGDELKLTPQTKREAIKIIEQVRANRLDVGKSPMSIAGAAIYLACLRTGERRTQQMVAKAAKTTPVTLRNRFKEIAEALELSLEIKRGAAATPVYFKNPWE